MNLQQMRYLSEVVRQGLRVSAAARVLNTSQPAVTKQLIQFESELGAPVFVRERHRIVRLTPMGQRVAKLAQEVCLSINTIRRIGEESAQRGGGKIRIATTHAQAQFLLPEPIQRFSERFKHVQFELERALPAQIISAVASGDVDLGVTPGMDPSAKDVIFLAYQSFPRIVLLPTKHPLLRKKRVSLEILAQYPIITTGPGLAGRTEVLSVFAARGIQPTIQLSAPDFDVVKVCVERGLGIAILPSYTYERHRDKHIRSIDVSHIFPPSVTNVVVRRNLHLPRLVYQFLDLLIPGKWGTRISEN